jgi:hypothetical protein
MGIPSTRAGIVRDLWRKGVDHGQLTKAVHAQVSQQLESELAKLARQHRHALRMLASAHRKHLYVAKPNGIVKWVLSMIGL